MQRVERKNSVKQFASSDNHGCQMECSQTIWSPKFGEKIELQRSEFYRRRMVRLQATIEPGQKVVLILHADTK